MPFGKKPSAETWRRGPWAARIAALEARALEVADAQVTGANNTSPLLVFCNPVVLRSGAWHWIAAGVCWLPELRLYKEQGDIMYVRKPVGNRLARLAVNAITVLLSACFRSWTRRQT